MSDQIAVDAPATDAPTDEQLVDAQQKPTETVEFWKSKAREQEKRAKENATAAQRLSEIEDAQKSESERAAERIKTLESEAESARREALRFKVASKHGIADEDAELFLTGSDAETLTRQAERLAARSDERKKHGNYVPKEGAVPHRLTASEADRRAFVRQLTGRD